MVFCDLPQVPPGPIGNFLLTQMAVVAGLTSQRTRAALVAAKARGTVLGKSATACGCPGSGPRRRWADARISY